MTEVISVKFKSCGKNYFFDPAGVRAKFGDKVIVDTAKGLEMAECSVGNHYVEDTAVVQPLRAVVRLATSQDLRSAEMNKAREKEALGICRQKIAEHELDMKLVEVECSFDGSKTTFYFTSDGRVDFRELVKDLAGVFHNRIELRQIGVRDEAKLIGGIGICGRPYCCSQFLEDFAPVSTKMAKVQSLSLNPAKISGSCGRLMCCLRYEEEAYEDLLTRVPKQGAYVRTPDGFGVASQINLLRQTVRVNLDNEPEDSVHEYSAEEIVSVPGGRPAEGDEMPDIPVPVRVEKKETEPEENPWNTPGFFAEESSDEPEKETADHPAEAAAAGAENPHRERRSRNRRRGDRAAGEKTEPEQHAAETGSESKEQEKPGRKDGRHGRKHQKKNADKITEPHEERAGEAEKAVKPGKPGKQDKTGRSAKEGKPSGKNENQETGESRQTKTETSGENRNGGGKNRRPGHAGNHHGDAAEKKPETKKSAAPEGKPQQKDKTDAGENEKKKAPRRHYGNYYRGAHRKTKTQGSGTGSGETGA